jgi:hypothetical protein
MSPEMEDERQVNEEISPLPTAGAFGLVCFGWSIVKLYVLGGPL